MSKSYTLKDLELPDDEPMVIIRSSFLWICDGDKYAAAALNMYVHWTKWLMKRKPVAQEINMILEKQGSKASQDTSLILYRKQSALVDDLLHFCNEKRLRKANDFLESKGLLKIDDTPRSISDHVLKYELQVDVFKKYMKAWRKHRDSESADLESDATEVALEADLDGTDNSPSRNGQFTDTSSSRNGQKPARNGQFTDSYRNRDDSDRDDERESDSPTHSPLNSLTPDQQHVYYLWCQMWFNTDSKPKVTPTLIGHCKTLAPHIHTLDQMKNLEQFTRAARRLEGKSLQLGNMVNCLNDWRQTQIKPSESKTLSLAERNRLNREKYGTGK